MRTFYGNDIPDYAILSHTWLRDHEEVTYQRYHLNDDWQRLRGGKKIIYLCQQAAKDQCRWAWIDTCCIDKTNNAELSEAINSMFRWYQDAKVCYVYLADIGSNEHKIFYTSRWWDRAWTLQELLAAKTVEFYDKDWRNIGAKAELAEVIALRKNIDKEILRDPDMIQFRSVAQRMSWAAHRQATRREDLAYALLGIFGINMNMMYGEGDKAFIRLQIEIMRSTNDMSLFAWNFRLDYLDAVMAKTETNGRSIDTYGRIREESPSVAEISRNGLFAPTPSCFSMCGDIEFLQEYADNIGVSEQQGIFRLAGPLTSIEIQKTRVTKPPAFSDSSPSAPIFDNPFTFSGLPPFAPVFDNPVTSSGTTVLRVAILPCSVPTEPHALIGMCLHDWQPRNASETRPARTIRKGFTGSTYTCLLPKKDVSEVLFTEAKIDPSSEAMLLSNTMLRKIARRSLTRTLRIQFDGLRHGIAAPYFDVKAIGREEYWHGTLSYKNIDWKDLSMPHLNNTANAFHVGTEGLPAGQAWVVKLAHTNATRALYIRLHLSTQLEGEKDLLAMTVRKPMVNSPDFKWPDLEKVLKSNHNSHQALKDGTFASIRTSFVFNHAISTLAIGLKEKAINAVDLTSAGPTWWGYDLNHTGTAGMNDPMWDTASWEDYSYTTPKTPATEEASTFVPKEKTLLPSKRDYSSFTEGPAEPPEIHFELPHALPTSFSIP